ncbi:hypothetical protein Taro_046854 [Colocasia esculenta]|uniref:Uncharacterized protein n=1 Tax=Colocasia esculenta TaxID=4460 RepID=A0A843WZQ0_COLES|nr:hypothetical protein [Colocasia esculenta]
MLNQACEIYEKLWFSGRLEDEKKVPTLILSHSENAAAEGDATIDASTKADATSVYRGAHGDRDTRLWQVMVGVVLRLGRMSIGVRRRVSSRPQHPKVRQYFLYHLLWIMACSCKAWFRQCRPRRRLRWQCRLSCMLRLRLQLSFPRSMAMVGESQPLLAESWMREVEKIIRAIRCAEEDKVSLATYMLQRSVQERERDGSVPGGEEGSLEDVRATFSEAGQEEGSVPITAGSNDFE